ncbi:MAG: DUF2029 domain-containing protein [Deltaproteobacteria bacterium]|nr:DUF2029 domain-containing protein [Deltaproteobacteria bacterium]
MIIYAIVSVLIWLAVTLISHGLFGTEGFFYDLPNGRMPFGRFFILYTLAFIVYLAGIIRVSRLSADRRNILIIISASIVFRLVLLPGIPVHENDIYRYMWDGKVAIHGINPYKYAPIQASIKPVSSERIYDFEKLKSLRDKDPKSYRRIGFKDIPTVYPPFAQAVFAFSSLLAPGSILLMKFLFALFDAAVIFLLYMILRTMKQNPLYVIVYAWNPLVLKEFANSGHYDALALCCVVAAVYLILKEKYLFSSICLGLGILSRFYPVIFIPFYLLKKQYKAFFASLVVVAAGYLPFLTWGNTGPKAVFAGLGTYTQEWTNNGFIYSLIQSGSFYLSDDPVMFSRIICGMIFITLWIFIFFNRQGLIEKMLWAVTALFLISPAGFPWYFCWVIPFLCIYRRFSLIALSGLLIMHYFVFTRDFGVFNIGYMKINSLLLMQYAPFYVMLIIEWRLRSASNRRNSI